MSRTLPHAIALFAGLSISGPALAEVMSIQTHSCAIAATVSLFKLRCPESIIDKTQEADRVLTTAMKKYDTTTTCAMAVIETNAAINKLIIDRGFLNVCQEISDAIGKW